MEKEFIPKQGNTSATESEENKKLTYEELEDTCKRLIGDNRKLLADLQRADQIITWKKLDYLLKIVELSDKFGDAEFIAACIDEIKESFIPPKKEEAEGEMACKEG